ncbi:unnamed protein product, partial [Durusdinium trenchii]
CATEPRPNDLEAVVKDHHEETEEEDDQDFAVLSDEGDDSSTVEQEDGHHVDAGESDGHPATNGLQQGEPEARALGAERVREHRAKRKKAEDEHAARDCMDFCKWAQPKKTPADADSGATEKRSDSEPKATMQDKDSDGAKEMPLDEKPILATLQKMKRSPRFGVVACSLWTMQAKWKNLVSNVLPDEFIKAGKLADANFFEREAEKILSFAAASELQLPGTQPMKQQLILIND